MKRWKEIWEGILKYPNATYRPKDNDVTIFNDKQDADLGLGPNEPLISMTRTHDRRPESIVAIWQLPALLECHLEQSRCLKLSRSR